MTAFQLAPILLGLLVLLPVALMSRKASSDPTRAALRSLATAKELAALTPAGALESARRLRPGLPAQPEPAETGLALGALRPKGTVLRASWEDVLVAVMAPRSGKTTSLAVPAVLDAPGPVVATSNKADLWAATAQLRAETGRVWTFDPQAIARAPRTWWWDPVRELADVESAERLASHFVLTVDDDRSRDIWGPAAQELLAALLMAARQAGRDLLAVYSWPVRRAGPRTRVGAARGGATRVGRLARRGAGLAGGDPGVGVLHRPHRRPLPARPEHHRLGHPTPHRRGGGDRL